MKLLTEPRTGSYANLQFARNQFGQYVRSRGPANATITAYRLNAKADLAAAESDWSGLLTDAQRQAWNTWAAQLRRSNALGTKINIDGHLLFISCVTASKSSSVQPGTPIVGMRPQAIPLEFASPAPAYDLNAKVIIEDGCWVAVYATGYERPTIYRPPGRGHWWFRISHVDLRSLTGLNPISLLIMPDLVSRYGSPVVGQWAHIRVRTISRSGLQGPPLYLGRIEF